MKTVERIEKLLEYLNMGPVVLANKAGIARTQIADIKNGRVKKISYNTAAAICRIFPTISQDWLLTGEGEMLVPSAQSAEDTNKNNVNSHAHEINELLTVVHLQQEQISKLLKKLEDSHDQYQALSKELASQREMLLKRSDDSDENYIHHPLLASEPKKKASGKVK